MFLIVWQKRLGTDNWWQQKLLQWSTGSSSVFKLKPLDGSLWSWVNVSGSKIASRTDHLWKYSQITLNPKQRFPSCSGDIFTKLRRRRRMPDVLYRIDWSLAATIGATVQLWFQTSHSQPKRHMGACSCVLVTKNSTGHSRCLVSSFGLWTG